MDNENMNTMVDTEAVDPKQMLLADLEAGGEQSAMEPETATVENTLPEDSTAQGPQLSTPTEAMTASTGDRKLTSDEILERLSEGVKNGQGAATPTEEPVAEEEAPLPDFNSEEFLDEFYDNPANAVEKAANLIAEKKVKEVVSGIEKRLQPLLDQSEAAQVKNEVRDVIGSFINENSDARELFPDMANYIKMNGLDPTDKKSYIDAYRESKIGKQGKEIEQLRANQGKTLSDYLGDDSSLDEIVSNENVSKRVIENYLRGLQNGNKPATIGMGGTSQPAATPANRPQTIKEAGRLLRDQLGK